MLRKGKGRGDTARREACNCGRAIDDKLRTAVGETVGCRGGVQTSSNLLPRVYGFQFSVLRFQKAGNVLSGRELFLTASFP